MSSDQDTDSFFETEAPYGRFKNGKARRTPAGTVKAPARKRGGGAKLTVVPPNYQAAAEGAVTIVGAVLGMFGRRSPALLADSTVIMSAKKPLAGAVAEVALTDIRVAQFLEKMGTVGPWGKVLEKVAPVVAQILTNHNLVPVGTMGSVAPGKILEQGRKEEVAQNAEEGKLCAHCGSADVVAMDQEGAYYCQAAFDQVTADAALAEAAAAVTGDPVAA